jgi:hypothetical protein
MKRNSFIIFSHLNLKCKNNVITDEWMEHRLSLLEAVTLNSLRVQDDKDFLYVLACDEDTEPKYKKRIEKMMIPNGVIAWIPEAMTNNPCKNSKLLIGDAGAKVLAPYIKADSNGFVWTTHIGTDDALSRDYVSRMKNAYDFSYFQYHGFLYFPSGYVCMSRTKQFWEVSDTKYFFLTLREPIDTFRSVLYTPHSRLHRRAPVAKVGSRGTMWIKTIHENQIGRYKQWDRAFTKRETKGEPADYKIVNSRFGIDISKITSCSTQ